MQLRSNFFVLMLYFFHLVVNLILIDFLAVSGNGLSLSIRPKPIVAITETGKVYKLMAIANNGDLLQVRGVRKSGYIIHIKAIGKDGSFYGVKAISQKGKLNDVKGIKMYDKRLEVTLNGVEVHAHVVALPQIQ